MKVCRQIASLLVVSSLSWSGIGLFTGCDDYNDQDLPDSGVKGEGEKCELSAECDINLACAGTGTCQKSGAKGTTIEGAGCGYNTDCLYHLVCSSAGTCVKPGQGKVGDACVGNQFCIKELLCSSQKQCSKPGTPGTKTPNETCEGLGECASGLVCAKGICHRMGYWEGVKCAAADPGPFKAYFEIPRTGKEITEFYRLPFPNDIRLKNGRVDLRGHPRPPTPMFKDYGDMVGNFISAINKDVRGFGVNTTIFFRLSNAFDLDSIKIEFLNIDKNSPGYGQANGWSMGGTAGDGSDNKYICRNRIEVRPFVGHPLLPSTTYAVLLKKGLVDLKNKEAIQDQDFKIMLANGPPSDPDLKAAWTAYAPLRAYLKDKSIDRNQILSAAVFTTMNPRYRMATFRQVINNQLAAPTAKDLTLCDGKAKAPCDNGRDFDHKCPASVEDTFHELQGLYQAPLFQKGTLPYRTVSDGGAITYDSSDKPIIHKKVDLCFALSVPKATMPTHGWPIVIYAHGTGNNYRTFIENGTASRLSHIQDRAGKTLSRMAVISIDAVMHGPQRGANDEPKELFFNLRNPRAARDNVYQGAADKHQLLRLIKAIDLEASKSPTTQALKFDLNKIYFLGHSQGTKEGIPFLAYEPEVKAAVLSGAGGYTIGSLLAKTKPLNIAGVVKLSLADPNLNASHPVLNLMQLFFEEVDNVNYGSAMFYKPTGSSVRKHIFLSYGVADGYTPPATTDALGWSMAIRQVKQEAQRCGDGVCGGTESCGSCVTDCKKCPPSCGNKSCEGKHGENCQICPQDCKPCKALYDQDDPPVKANISSGGKKITAGLVKYSGDGSYDDHLSIFKNPNAKTQAAHFFGSAATDEDNIPTIPEIN